MHPDRPTRPLRLGILGCANIAHAFARAVAASPAVALTAVASRDAAKARAFAETHGIGRHHAGYEALLADDAVDAVYIPLPNSLHAPWAIRAAEHGKHVLCEKPLATSAADARAMFAAARQAGVVLLESYPYWFQPQTGRLVAMLHDGTVGPARFVQASFGFTLTRSVDIRLETALGGGALLDAGSYPASLIRLVMGSAPRRVEASARRAASGVDLATTATLLWDDGRSAQLACAMDVSPHRHALIAGRDAVVVTDYLNHTTTALPSAMHVRRTADATTPYRTEWAADGNGFRFAAEAFARVIAARDTAAVERAAAASLDIAATLEAIARAARDGGSVEVRVPESAPPENA